MANIAILFTASWCAPCKKMKPHFETALSKRDDWGSMICDVDENPALAQRFRVVSYPSVGLLMDDEVAATYNSDEVFSSSSILEKLSIFD